MMAITNEIDIRSCCWFLRRDFVGYCVETRRNDYARWCGQIIVKFGGLSSRNFNIVHSIRELQFDEMLSKFIKRLKLADYLNC